MKITYVICAAILILGITDSKSETLNIAGSVWCPNNCFPDTNRPGIMLEVVEKALDKAGRSMTYTEVPWSRAILQTRSGEFDALIGSSRFDTPDFIFSGEPITITRNCFFTRTDSSWKFTDISSLESEHLGIGNDESVSNEIDNYIANNENVAIVSGSNYMERLIVMLLSNRISTVIADKNVFNYLISRTVDRSMIRNAGCIDEPLEIFLAFSPELFDYNSLIIRQFDQAIREMKDNGDFDLILERYNAKPW